MVINKNLQSENIFFLILIKSVYFAENCEIYKLKKKILEFLMIPYAALKSFFLTILFLLYSYVRLI